MRKLTATDYEQIADAAIKSAKAALGHDHVINMGEAAKESGITGYIARQADGVIVDGEVEAQSILDAALAKMYKKKKGVPVEARSAYQRVYDMKVEYNLIG